MWLTSMDHVKKDKIKSLFIVFGCCLLAFSAVVYSLVKKQQNEIFKLQLSSADKSLNFYASTARIPLLADDYLTLNNMIRAGADGPDIEYVAIVDQHGLVKAHTDPDLLDTEFVPAQNVFSTNLTGADLNITLLKKSADASIIDLSTKVTFNKKNIGTVHLGLPVAYLVGEIGKVKWVAFKTIFITSLLFAVFIVFFDSGRRKRFCQSPAQEVVFDNKQQDGYSGNSGKNGRGKSGSQAIDLNRFTHNSSLTRVLSQPVNTPSSYATRKQATILFAGIKNFNEYAGDGNPEDIIHALNEYIRLASDVISSHGGYVDKIIGDAVIGIFGVSVYRTDHSERAVRAAYQLQQQLLTASLAQKNPLLGMVRIGISSGVVLSGNIGAHSKVEYSSIGESIKEAFWLNNAAGQAEILLDRNVFNLCHDFVEVEQLAPMTLLGQSAVVECYRLKGLKKK